jgi:tyrosyl-tRNA synthetase
LTNLLERVKHPQHYIGFEISGKIHLGTGLMCMAKIRDFVNAEIKVSILLADWHSWINDKLGGDRETIERIAGGYFKDGLVAGLKCVGGDPTKVKFVLGTSLYHHNDDYWSTVVEISKNTTLARISRSTSILGRSMGQSIDFAKLIYPPMQVADIFIQGIHLAHAGLDQRKAHVIAREVANNLKISPLLDDNNQIIKPIAVHHHLLLGLGKPAVWPPPKEENLKDFWTTMKMSKSKPDTAIFIHDSPEVISRKINKAFCPEGEVEFNPILDWTKYLLFEKENTEFVVERKKKFGGDITLYSFQEVENAFKNKKLHPLDLKRAVALEIIKILKPARKYFEIPSVKRNYEELNEILFTV